MPGLTLKCVHCGKPFRAKSRRDRLCSKPCRVERAKAQRAKWFKDNREGMAQYWQQYHADRRHERNAANLSRYYRSKGRAGQ
jgi:hypothetical protein